MKRHFFAFSIALVAAMTVAQNKVGGVPPVDQSQIETKVFSSPEEEKADPLLDVPAMPKGNVSLIGGLVTSIDRVQNKVTVEPFGGHKVKVFFDERTHIFRDGVETTQLAIRKGDRVYVDTMRDGDRVFARNIRMGTKISLAFTRGQVLAFNRNSGELELQDGVMRQPVRVLVVPNTTIQKGDATASRSELQRGALISVQFLPEGGKTGVAQKISVIAVPGERFTFAGRIMHLDLSAGLIAIQSATDGKMYDIRLGRALGIEKLAVGAEANVEAEFNGTDYVARRLTLSQTAVKEE